MSLKYPWVYHGEAPKAGRKLLLLEESELTVSLPLIFRIVHPSELDLRKDWFSDLIIEMDKSDNPEYIILMERLQQVTLNRKKQGTALTQSLTLLNQQLNLYFSDYGWRMVRKELSQIKKRQKKSHIELSNDLIVKIKMYMEKERFDSFDQAIDNLLTEAEAIKKEAENC
ncbi:hypothetical protein [Shewanella sp. UCD-KL12]|uniref:hypothetical protein n=1 Tax=Shewanella sp. UCD-KL12 TaxID=1917163 RepID=UPI00097136B5|nr:hypothetical protein [Shewanella sp. UCD-KL12]